VLSLVSSWFGFLAVPSAEKRCAYTSVPHPSWYPSSGEFRLLMVQRGGQLLLELLQWMHLQLVVVLVLCPRHQRQTIIVGVTR